ncbi:21545_t:CDS:2, partial [Dentiscutata erythropus]
LEAELNVAFRDLTVYSISAPMSNKMTKKKIENNNENNEKYEKYKRQKLNNENEDVEIEIIVKLYKKINQSSNPELSTVDCIKLPRKIKLDEVRKKLSTNEHGNDSDFHMGSNCRFLHFNNDEATIRLDDEITYKLSAIIEERIEEKNDQLYLKHYLYIKHNAKFDLTFPAAYSGLVSAFLCLSYKNSNQGRIYHTANTKHSCELIQKGEITISDIVAKDDFINDVKKALNETIQDNLGELRKVFEKYGHFYARRLILGGIIMRSEKYIKNSGETSKINNINMQAGVEDSKNSGETSNDNDKDTQVNFVRNNESINSFCDSIKNNSESHLGGRNFQSNNKNPWRESLEDETTWEIVGYDKIFSLFELLDESLQKKVLGVLGHRILKAKIDERSFDIEEYKTNKKPYCALEKNYMNEDKNRPVFVVHHIQEEQEENSVFKFFKPKKAKKVKIKLCWIIVGPPTSFDFSIQYPLVLTSEKQSVLVDKDNYIINSCSKLGTCVLETTNNTAQIESCSNNSDTGKITHDINRYNPGESPYVIGNYFTSQESAQLFIYENTEKGRKKVTNETVLKRLALYICAVDTTNPHQIWEEMDIEWEKGNNILYMHSKENFDQFKNNLILMNQKFDCMDCTTHEHHGFVNINSDKIICGSLNSELDSKGSVVYLLVPSIYL